jgi:hypothetical protein
MLLRRMPIHMPLPVQTHIPRHLQLIAEAKMLDIEVTKRQYLLEVMAEELRDTQPLRLQEAMEAGEIGTARHRPTQLLLPVDMGVAATGDMEDRLLLVSVILMVFICAHLENIRVAVFKGVCIEKVIAPKAWQGSGRRDVLH